MSKAEKKYLKWFDLIGGTFSGTLGWQCTGTFKTPITFKMKGGRCSGHAAGTAKHCILCAP